ncbi:MAG: hypothetical protein JWN25_2795 [Verrucomicrobiales bacterium]|nr:hypothetical protein [Verrucomicrobiales bacterium]
MERRKGFHALFFVFILHGSFDFFDLILLTSYPTDFYDARGLELVCSRFVLVVRERSSELASFEDLEMFGFRSVTSFGKIASKEGGDSMLCSFVFILHGSFDFFDLILVTSYPTIVYDARGLESVFWLVESGHREALLTAVRIWSNHHLARFLGSGLEGRRFRLEFIFNSS